MAKITYNICVLIVTYSNRWQFLEQILKRVAVLENIAAIVVVDNASDYSVEQNCVLLQDERIKVITNAENRGSAGGYKMGLQYFMTQTDANFVWLLDDDNLPAMDTLEKLTDIWPAVTGGDHDKALFSLRPDRRQHLRIARGENAERFFMSRNSFMGFNLFRIPINQYHKLLDKFRKPGAFLDKALMPYAPYGGMFLHREMVERIGYPEESFFVYADDSEYTCRITAQGGKIWLVPSSIVTDIDQSYGIKYVPHFWRSIYLDMWSFRTYYQVRNSVFFFARVNVDNPVIYGMNKSLFLMGQWVISRITGKQENYKKLKMAIEDGSSGRLGMVDTEKINKV